QQPYPPNAYGQPYGQPGYGQPMPGPQDDGKATASLILGILSLLCFGILAGIPAIILGHGARTRIRQSMGRLTGDGKALAGLILGYISVGFTLIWIPIIMAVLIPNVIRARTAANESTALSMVRTLNTTQVTYQATYPQNGYATSISMLGHGSGAACNGAGDSSAEHACLLSGEIERCNQGGSCILHGYRFTMQGDESQPHQQYVITATPVVAGNTGRRSFCSTSDGIIRYEFTSTSRSAPYTAEECAELTPL
ncbi:MAG TPA: DUF4190 domain-containing protein, partial [Ktedonobacteraceae bacterium]|nr:DUF4190 domain-containing protein [Ktedonobacteraceae bacterium]